jgi:elongation factor P
MAILVSQVSKGQVVQIDGVNFQVVDREHRTPGNLRAFYQLKLKNLATGAQFVKRFAVDDQVEPVFMERRSCQYLYPEGNKTGFVFMDNETYEQFTLTEDIVGDKMGYVPLNGNVIVMSLDGVACDIELPASVVLEIAEAEPAIRGNTATNVTKNATSTTGLKVKVPQHIEAGMKIIVDTRSGEFIQRSKD